MAGRLGHGAPTGPGKPLGPLVRAWRLVAAVALAGLLVAGLVAVPTVATEVVDALPVAESSTIEGRYLDGERGPSCLRLTISVDESGSMRDFPPDRM